MSDPLPRLARINRTAVFLGTLAVFLLGLFLPGAWGAFVLYLIVAALAAVLRRTWPVTPPPLRVFRLGALAVIAVVATAKLF